MPALSDLTLHLVKLSLPVDNFLHTQCDQVGFPPLVLGGQSQWGPGWELLLGHQWNPCWC